MIVRLHNQLGNQMFMYASIKSVCIETNKKFRFYIDDTTITNSEDDEYGTTIETIFKLNTFNNEEIKSLPNNYHYFKEPIKNRITNYLPGIKKLDDNTIMDGLFQSHKYFNNYKKILKWFEFKDSIIVKSSNIIEKVKNKYPEDTILCFVHFRQGNDYIKFGYGLHFDYYKKALKFIDKLFNSRVVFVAFYDVENTKIKKVLDDYKYEIIHGSLVDDLSCMSLCDAAIISNSTFSWWGAFLQKNNKITVRPSDFFAYGTSISPQDIFLSNWVPIEAKRSMKSKIYGYVIEAFDDLRLYMKKKFSRQYNLIKSIINKIIKVKFNNYL